MKGYPKQELIPVRSESELRAGMMVVTKGCELCGGHWSILMRLVGHAADGTARWMVITSCPVANPDAPTRFRDSISLGRLFRFDTGIDEEADRRQDLADSIGANLRLFANRKHPTPWKERAR